MSTSREGGLVKNVNLQTGGLLERRGLLKMSTSRQGHIREGEGGGLIRAFTVFRSCRSQAKNVQVNWLEPGHALHEDFKTLVSGIPGLSPQTLPIHVC